MPDASDLQPLVPPREPGSPRPAPLSPCLPIVATCKARVARSLPGGYEYLTWIQCWCAGLVDYGARAW